MSTSSTDHPSVRAPRRGDRGEGVISTAIAVLVMAFLGAAMWITFNSVWKDTAQNTENQVNIIGSDAGGSPTGP